METTNNPVPEQAPSGAVQQGPRQQDQDRAAAAVQDPRPQDPPHLAGWSLEAEDEREADVTRVYLAVLQHPQPSRSLLLAQGLAPEVVDASLRVLAGRGLVRVHDGNHLEVLPPDIALPALAAEFERRARDTRGAAHELSQVYFQARAQTPQGDGTGVRVLRSMDELAAATADIVSAATSRVRIFRALSPRTRELFSAPTHSHESVSTGVAGVPIEIQATYDSSVLGLENALDILAARERGGERFRFVTGVPFSAIVVDESAAVVDTSVFEASGAGSALVRSRPLVQALGSLADLFWNLGSPLPRTGSARSAEARDRTILALLAAGAPDATIARQTGVSQRTVERRVRALMDQLGAGTRFQAGVQAARRGLV